jgi:hypothetical protein
MFPSPSRSVSKWQTQAVAIKQLKPNCKRHRLHLLCFMLITSVISRVAFSTISPDRNHDSLIKNTLKLVRQNFFILVRLCDYLNDDRRYLAAAKVRFW